MKFLSLLVLLVIISCTIKCLQVQPISQKSETLQQIQKRLSINGSKFLTKQDLNLIYSQIYLNQIHSKSSPSTCIPFYKRLFYNQNNTPSASSNLKTQPSSSQALDMTIYFNTNISCPKSYVTVEVHQMKIVRFQCDQTKISLPDFNGTKGFTQFVHKCGVFFQEDQARFIYDFTYMIYGQVVNFQQEYQLIKQGLNQQQIDQLKSLSSASQSYQVQIYKKDRPMRMIVLGDWAPIFIRPYFPVHQSLVHLINLRQEQKHSSFNQSYQYRITCLYIVGDIAYNLEDFNGMKYNWFMSQLERLSTYWPIVIIPGNHDDYTPGNRYLLENSFDIGRLTVKDGNFTRLKWYRFANQLNLLFFNPYYQVYGFATTQQTQAMTSYFKTVVNEIQQKYPDQFLVVTSHYPVICSQLADSHCNAMQKVNSTKQLLDFMTRPVNGKKGPVDFYIGSHMHQYQRAYPYAYGNYETQQNFTYTRGHMTSVVQGVAGCDYGIISEDFKRQSFSISASYAKTGYGFLKIEGTTQTKDKTKFYLNYRHLVATPAPTYFQNYDNFTIYTQLPRQNSQPTKIQQSFQFQIESIYKYISKQLQQFANDLFQNPQQMHEYYHNEVAPSILEQNIQNQRNK